MTLYRLTVERTIEATVEVEATDPLAAEITAEFRADRGDYDDVFDDLAADARHATFGVERVEDEEEAS